MIFFTLAQSAENILRIRWKIPGFSTAPPQNSQFLRSKNIDCRPNWEPSSKNPYKSFLAQIKPYIVVKHSPARIFSFCSAIKCQNSTKLTKGHVGFFPGKIAKIYLPVFLLFVLWQKKKMFFIFSNFPKKSRKKFFNEFIEIISKLFYCWIY